MKISFSITLALVSSVFLNTVLKAAEVETLTMKKIKTRELISSLDNPQYVQRNVCPKLRLDLNSLNIILGEKIAKCSNAGSDVNRIQVEYEKVNANLARVRSEHASILFLISTAEHASVDKKMVDINIRELDKEKRELNISLIESAKNLEAAKKIPSNQITESERSRRIKLFDDQSRNIQARIKFVENELKIQNAKAGALASKIRFKAAEEAKLVTTAKMLALETSRFVTVRNDLAKAQVTLAQANSAFPGGCARTDAMSIPKVCFMQ